MEQGWSRDTLVKRIQNRAHERQGVAVTNFATTLPEAHAAIAQGLLTDPYIFDFLTLDEPFHERELETGLIQKRGLRVTGDNPEPRPEIPLGIGARGAEGGGRPWVFRLMI